MRCTLPFLIAAMVVMLIQCGCGRKPAIKPAVEPPPECVVIPASGERGDSIAIAVFDAVRPEHAPWSRNAGEQMVFHHLYETLIEVDCRGRVQPGLAESWKKEDQGRCWRFTIRKDARYWDGSHVSAHDIVKSWRQVNIEPSILDAGVDSVSAANDRTLNLYFHYARKEVPLGLSSPLFAVAKLVEDVNWPVGTGRYRPGTTRGGKSGKPPRSGVILPSAGDSGPVITYINASRTDARDLLEREVDMMVTADPTVIAYAATRPQLRTVALPWDKTYVLLPATRVRELLKGVRFHEIPLDFTAGLARDAVRGDARGHQSPAWWDALTDCTELAEIFPWRPNLPRGAQAHSGTRRILYPAADPVARDLAERIVALAAAGPEASSEAAAVAAAVPGLVNDTVSVLAEGVDNDEYMFSLRDGQDFGYIIAISRRPPDVCDEARRLIHRAPWLAVLKYDFCKALIPLVDTRSHVIANRRAGRLVTDWYGNVRITTGMSQER